METMDINLVIYAFIIQYIIMAAFGGYFMYYKRVRMGYRALFYRKLNGTYIEVGERDIKSTAETVRFGDRSFPVDFSRVAFRQYGYHYICFDIGTQSAMNKTDSKRAAKDSGRASILTFGGEFEVVDPKLVDTFIGNGIFKEILNRMKGVDKSLLIIFIAFAAVVGVMAFLGGYLVGGGGHTVEVISNSTLATPTPVPVIGVP